MTITEAFRLLQPLKKVKIADIYDLDDNSEAFLVLMPTFEYPDWSHLAVARFLHYL